MADNLLLPFTLDRAVDSAGLAYEAAVYVYDAGTTDEKNVYTNATLVTAADNPVLSDSGGWFDARFIGTGSYKLVFYKTNGSVTEADWTLIKSADNLPGALDTSSFLTGTVTAETPVVYKTALYTILTTDLGKLIVGDTTGGGFTFTLPSAVTATDGFRISVAHGGTANELTIATVSSQTINDSGTSRILYTKDEEFTLVSDGANWRIDGYGISKLTHGKFIGRTTTGDGSPQIVIVPFGQCRLAKSGSALVLSPYNGNILTIDSKAEVIPDAGVSLAVSGLSNSTLYYVYAYMDSGVMTLEASATAYTIGAGSGIYTKTGDTLRTLVGMCYLLGGAFIDSATQRYVRSWFNDPGIATSNALTADRTVSSSSATEVNSEIRNEFLLWSGDIVDARADGALVSAGDVGYVSIAFDDAVFEDTMNRFDSTSVDGAFAVSLFKTGLAEGYHYATLSAKVATGNIVFEGSAGAGERSTLKLLIRK